MHCHFNGRFLSGLSVIYIFKIQQTCFQFLTIYFFRFKQSVTPLYESDSKALNKPEVQEGLKLWHAFKKFAELEENKRWDKHEIIMSKFAPLARLGKQIPKELLDEINSRVVLSNKEASLRADPEALWICYSNAEVDEINKEQTAVLEEKGNQKYKIWAKYVVSSLPFN